MAILLLSLLGAVAEFDRALILERQREGIAIAKAAGKYRGRRPVLSADRVALIRERIAAGESKVSPAREFGISRETLYAYLKSKGKAEKIQGAPLPSEWLPVQQHRDALARNAGYD